MQLSCVLDHPHYDVKLRRRLHEALHFLSFVWEKPTLALYISNSSNIDRYEQTRQHLVLQQQQTYCWMINLLIIGEKDKHMNNATCHVCFSSLPRVKNPGYVLPRHVALQPSCDHFTGAFLHVGIITHGHQHAERSLY